MTRGEKSKATPWDDSTVPAGAPLAATRLHPTEATTQSTSVRTCWLFPGARACFPFIIQRALENLSLAPGFCWTVESKICFFPLFHACYNRQSSLCSFRCRKSFVSMPCSIRMPCGYACVCLGPWATCLVSICFFSMNRDKYDSPRCQDRHFTFLDPFLHKNITNYILWRW